MAAGSEDEGLGVGAKTFTTFALYQKEGNK